MTFLPKDYVAPKAGGNYLKFKDGDTTFRILSSAVTGYEYWNTDNKPVRSKTQFSSTPKDIKLDKDGVPTKVKHFWSMVVNNEDENKIQILQISQKSIQDAIKALVENKKWGAPTGYDITVTRSGDGLETSYTVMPNPHTPVSSQVQKDYEDKNVNLEALFTGADPFTKAEPTNNVDF